MLALKVLLECFGIRHLGLQKGMRNITKGKDTRFLQVAKHFILITCSRIYKLIVNPFLFLGQPHTHPAHRAGEYQRCLGCSLLIVTFGFLLLCLFFGISLLRLNLLMPTCHFITIWGKKKNQAENITLILATLHS